MEGDDYEAWLEGRAGGRRRWQHPNGSLNHSTYRKSSVCEFKISNFEENQIGSRSARGMGFAASVAVAARSSAEHLNTPPNTSKGVSDPLGGST